MSLKDYLYYQDDWATIYCGDCLEILPLIEKKDIDLIATDPPYKQFKVDFQITPINFLNNFSQIQFVFWATEIRFPLSFTAKHKWIKNNNFGGRGYEVIYERNGSYMPWEHETASINSELSATMKNDIYTKHPTQKPIQIMQWIIKISMTKKTILDPFLGSGTTCIAAKNLNRKSIGIEINPDYCEIAVKRLRQEVFDFRK